MTEPGTRGRAPGPRGHLLLGSAPEIAKDPLGAYSALAREFGDVVLVRFVRWPTYLLFHPDDVRHVLQEKHLGYSKDLYTYRVLRLLTGAGLITNDGAAWLRQRRLIQPAFHRQRLAAVGDVAADACGRLLQRWDSAADKQGVLDVHREMTRLGLEVAGRALFQVDLAVEAEETGRLVAELNALLTQLVYAPLPPLIVPTPRNLRFRAARRDLDRTVQDIIAERRARGGDRGDVLSMLLLARDEETGEGMDDRQVRDEVVTLLIAGHETTASLLAWACHLVAGHPTVDRQLRAEALALGGGPLPRLADLPRLGYTRMVLEEALRLYPPAWSFGRKAVGDDEIGGYRVPRGSLVWVSPYVTHRDPRFWSRPEEFDPERFTPERVAAIPRFAYFPFGGGPRLCIGSQFAMVVAQLTLAAVAARFRLRPAGGAPVEPEALLSLRPRGGLPMVVERA